MSDVATRGVTSTRQHVNMKWWNIVKHRRWMPTTHNFSFHLTDKNSKSGAAKCKLKPFRQTNISKQIFKDRVPISGRGHLEKNHKKC